MGIRAGVMAGLGLSLLAQQPPTTIRSRTTLVPVDVRVVDAKGNPVTNLKKEDFVVEENGKPQDIQFFDARGLTPQPAAATEPLLRTRAIADAPLQAQDRRIFLFVLGRGRHQSADKAVDAVMTFVGDRLLPQDRASVLAYNRATDFTTDRPALVATLERFKKAHEQIEADLVQYFGGLRAQYGIQTIPESIQKKIDAVFHGPGVAEARTLPNATPTDARTIASDRRNDFDTLQRAAVLAGRPPSAYDAFDNASADLLGVSLDEYEIFCNHTTQDLGNLYTGIRYLRYLNGEKHLVFVTEQGLFLPRLENDYSVAALASDARVVIDILRTGGIMLSGPGSPGVRPAERNETSQREGRNIAKMSWPALFASQTQRTIAELTGGMYNAFSPSARTLAAIDQSSRFTYMLGYVPSDGTFDGKYRRIAVKVNRTGVQVLSRHGYYARREDVPFDRQEFMTYSRVTAAANVDTPMTDLVLSATAAYQPGEPEADLTVTLKPDRIKFEDAEGHHKGSLQFVMFAGDARQHMLGEHWQTMDLDLSDENYQKFLAQGVSFTQRIPVQGTLKYVKVIAYDYSGDRVGTALVTIAGR